MKTKSWFNPRRGCLVLALMATLLGGGCLEKRIVWSPDGSRAAVLSKSGDLFLCDPEGRLTGKLATDVKLVVWLDDAGHLVLSRKREVRTWADAASLLGAARAAVEVQGEKALAALRAGTKWSALEAELKTHKDLVKIWLRDVHGDELNGWLTPEQAHGFRPGHLGATISDLVTARVEGETLVLGPVLCAQIGELTDLRPSPDGRAIAWTQESPEKTDDGAVFVLDLASGSPAPVVVAQTAAAYPDWTPDGRSLVFIQRQSQPTGSKDIAVGVVARREVLNAQGRIAVAEKPEYYAAVIFGSMTRVRCLRDGRILFNAPEMTFPMAAADFDGDHREQLFAIDPARQSTLVRLVPRGRESDLPQSLAFFEVSPDEKQVVFGGAKCEVAVLTLGTGAVDTVQDGDKEQFQGVPSWRGPGELCYVKRAPVKDGVRQGRPAEIVLRRGEKETVLSQSWPDKILSDVASQDRN